MSSQESDLDILRLSILPRIYHDATLAPDNQVCHSRRNRLLREIAFGRFGDLVVRLEVLHTGVHCEAESAACFDEGRGRSEVREGKEGDGSLLESLALVYTKWREGGHTRENDQGIDILQKAKLLDSSAAQTLLYFHWNELRRLICSHHLESNIRKESMLPPYL